MELECQRDTKIELKDASKTCLDKPRAGKQDSCELISSSDNKIIESLQTEDLGSVGKSCVKHGIQFSIPSPDYSRSFSDLPPALISEILNFLDPRELGVVSCVNTSLYRIASEHPLWKEFYHERWGHPVAPVEIGPGCPNDKSWKELFVEKEFRSKTFMGRYSLDTLYGHTEAVKTVFVLGSKKLVFTSGYDQVVKMWDLEEGLLVGSSPRLGCTIRAVAADSRLLIAGGTDMFIHGWNAKDGNPHLFDLRALPNQNMDFRIWGHEGPITCLALDFSKMYSGSWDMTIRVWDRSSLKCLKVLVHNDWVWNLVPHDTTIGSTAGSCAYIWDTHSGSQVAVINSAHAGKTYSLARSHTGKFLFTGGEDGSIHMFEITQNSKCNARRIATWTPHTGSVYSLAFEFPWLISSSGCGKISLIDVRILLKTKKHSSMNTSTVESPQRMLHGYSRNLFSVGIGCNRIICGGEEGVIRIWNFSQALEIEQRIRALRGLRIVNRMKRRNLQSASTSKASQDEQCSIAANKNQMTSVKKGWSFRRRVTSKLNA